MKPESEPTDLDRDIDASIRMFEKSKVGPAAPVTPIRPSRVMLVLDGSDQDEVGIDAAVVLRERFSTETLLLDARDKTGDEPSDLAIDRAPEVSGSRPIRRGEGEPYDAILAALDHHDVDLVIVPCPFGRTFESVGVDSAGTVIDVLLSRCSKPLLVMRRMDQRLGECSRHVSMIIGSECEMESRAAAWAFGLAAESASVTLDLVIEKEQYENIRSIIEAFKPDAKLDPEQFSDALTQTHQAIHGAMAKTASALKMSYALRPLAGEIAPPNPLHDSRKMLLVMPLEVDDQFGQGFVQNRIRRSPHPVLVVTGHVTRGRD
jgi:hypothetical protein